MFQSMNDFVLREKKYNCVQIWVIEVYIEF